MSLAPMVCWVAVLATAWAAAASDQDLESREVMNTRMFQWRNAVATGLAARCDLVVFKAGLARRSASNTKASSKSPDVVFINNRDYKVEAKLAFVKNIYGERDDSVVLIIAGADWTWPKQKDWRKKRNKGKIVKRMMALVNESFVHRVFVENLDTQFSPKVVPMPLGVNIKELNRDVHEHHESEWRVPTIGYYLQYANRDPDRALLASFSGRARVGPQWDERKRVASIAETGWADCMGIIQGTELSHGDFLQQLARFPFAVAVHGGGFDPNPRIWETLLVGSIPITRRLPTTTLYEEHDLPVVIVESPWTNDTITPEKLKGWHAKYKDYLVGEKRKEVLYKLTLDFWWDRITAAPPRH